MNRFVVLLVPTILAACSHSATNQPTANAVEQVRQAEVAFARAFSEGDEDQFASMISPDAYFLGPRRTLHGKEEIMSVWSKLIRDGQFSWTPERVAVTAGGTLGLSTGPIRDHSGKVTGQYSSIWHRQPDGTWKVIFDGPGSSCP